MKKITKRILSILMCLIMVMGIVPLSAFSVTAAEETTNALPNKVGDIIEFGSYPQSKVTDSALIDQLNALDKEWISYGYYSGTGYEGDGRMKPGDFMKYADVSFNGTKYRGVKFTEYRPFYTEEKTTSDDSYQDDNAYYTNTTYWFKYEPIKWRVLDPATGLVMCETIIDSQPYNNTVYIYGRKCYQNTSCTTYANDYATSSIRNWLNEDFYNTAFTSTEKSQIATSELDNSGYESQYDSARTNDKVFMLTYWDMLNTAYGFSSSYSNNDTARRAKSTDYAKSQGIYVHTGGSYAGNSHWWLRTPGYYSEDACTVDLDGYVSSNPHDVHSTLGVRPAMHISKGIFNEKKYIADIWLDRHGTETTLDSKIVKSIIGMETASETLYNTLATDKHFQNGLALWETMKVAFNTQSGVEELVLNRENLYESLILSLLKKVMEEENEEVGNIIYDAVETMGKGAGFVNKYKGVADGIISIPGDVLELIKDWKFDTNSKSFIEFSAGLHELDDVTKKWTDNKYIEGVGLIADAASSVADFYKRFLGYMIAVDMAEEMKILLMEMETQTTDGFFKSALHNVYNMIDNADFAKAIAALKLTEDLTLDFTKFCFNTLLKEVPGYGQLQIGYDIGVLFSDIVFNTSDVTKAYFLLEATNTLVDANRAAVTALGNEYRSTGAEEDAGAYVYAVRTYEQVYMVDIDNAESFIKKATVEGTLNKKKYEDTKFIRMFTGEKTSYEQFLQFKDNMLAHFEQQYYTIDNMWKFDPDYLKKDYPDMYPVYVNEEISQEKYRPYIVSAYIGEDGKTKINWGLPNVFFDGEDTYYPLYGIMAIDGVAVKEMIGTNVTEKEFSIANGMNEVDMYDANRFSTFDKYYSVKAYSETSVGNLYTKTSPTATVSKPTKNVKLTLPLFMDEMNPLTKGIKLAIEDPSDTIYENIKYKVYRKTATTGWELVKTVSRGFDFNGSITTFTDETAEKNVQYQYKVSSYITFDNGKTLTSDETAPLTVINSSMFTFARPANVKNSTFGNEVAPQTVVEAAESKAGVEISWEAFEGADQYEIYRMASYGTIYKKLATVDGNVLSYIDDTVENGVTYDYIVVPSSIENGNRVYDLNAYAQGEIEYTDGEVKSVTINDFTALYKDPYKIVPKVEMVGDVAYTVTYTSSDNDVVTVDKDGNITTKDRGTATITVTVTDEFGNEVKDTCQVEVKLKWWQWLIWIFLWGWAWY